MSNQTNNPTASDLSVMIKRLPHNQTYKLDLLIIDNGKPGKVEVHICQTLEEAFKKAAVFEAENLEKFENVIEYTPSDWKQQ
ncbi:Uncharacterised protein [Kingella potus]|uniref:Uncharacterized protein n=1 Tax=Kingella potus TaxID=265175 RepID=A0A377QXW8_9NEIS|nr:hypothetical protein [Kingella potus]UOP01472.1 hypothetical protein LVJ84_04575 [Kingella potus]STR00206.1 Uncharacterised protein [Kingella potus]